MGMIVTTDPLLFADLAFRGWFPRWLAALMGVAAVAAVVFVYLREAGRVPAWRRAVMAGMRALTLVSILFLLLRPTLVTEAHGERARPVALLVDNSQSMATEDARPSFADRWRLAVALDLLPPTKPIPDAPSAGDLPGPTPDKLRRIAVAQAALTNPQLNLIPALAKIGPLQPASFGATRSPADPRDGKWIVELKGTEPRTALADAVFDLLKRDANELPAAVVIATDGRDNASQKAMTELARECRRLEVPLHIYGVGNSAIGQVQVRDAITPDTLFVDDTVSVPVRFRLRGFKDGRAEVVLRLNGREVARKVSDVKEGEALREVLSFVPEPRDAATGRQELTASVRIDAGLDSVADELARSVRVVDRKMKVLVVDSIPRWDFKFLQRALLRDRRVEARFFLTDGDRRAMEAGPPFLPKFPADRAELFAYDLLILGDVPADVLTTEQQEAVREYVAEGGGLIHMAGRNHAPSSFARTPLADVLPVEITSVQFPIDSGARPDPFRPELTPQGVRSPLMSLSDDPVDSLRAWRTLPPIYWAYPVKGLKPAAEALLVHPTQKSADGSPMPLLATHYYGKGYVLYVGFDETWRWRFNEADRFFGRFWSQAVYVTGVPRALGTKLTQLSLDTTDPQLGKTGQVYARLFTPDLRPLTTDRIEAKLERLDVGAGDQDRTLPVELKALPGQPGDYVATVPFNQTGRFTLTVDTGSSDPGTLDYRVSLPPDHELAPGGMAEDDLRRLADQSGGKFYREENLHEMPTAVQRKTVPFTQREETLLWNRWAMTWVIGLLAAEWFLRKFNSLS